MGWGSRGAGWRQAGGTTGGSTTGSAWDIQSQSKPNGLQLAVYFVQPLAQTPRQEEKTATRARLSTLLFARATKCVVEWAKYCSESSRGLSRAWSLLAAHAVESGTLGLC